MTARFNRNINAVLTLPDGDGLIDFNKDGSSQLNIAFQVERNLYGEPNTALLTVFNPSAKSRDALQKARGWTLEIFANYGPESTGNAVFFGTVRVIRVRRQAPDIIVEIEADDGIAAQKNYVSRFFKKGTSLVAVFRWLQQNSGLGAGNVGRIASIGNPDGLPDRLEAGMTVRGYAMDELSDLARSREVRISSQGGQVTVLAPGEPLQGLPLVKLNPRTGLEEFPTIDNEGMLIAQARMVENLQPGSPVEVESENIKGRFVVERATYAGSIYGDEFGIEIEARSASE